MKIIKIITSLIVLLSYILLSESGLESATPTEKIVIFYYQDKSNSDKYGYYSHIIPDSIAREFRKEKRYNIQTMPETLQYIEKSGSENAFENHLKILGERGKKLSAEYIITGAYYIKDEKIYIKTQIFDVRMKKMVSVSESSPELGSLLINIVDNVTARINDELGKFDKGRNRLEYVTSKKNLYGIISLSFAQLALISFGVGYYAHLEMERAESRYDNLEYQYITTLDPKFLKEMEDEKDKVDENELYRNISYGVGAFAILATMVCTYKYLVYRAEENELRTEGGSSFLLTPLYSYGSPHSVYGSTVRGEQFLGAMISWRF